MDELSVDFSPDYRGMRVNLDIPYSVYAFQMEEYEGNCTTLVPEAFPPGETEADRRNRLLWLFYY